LAILSDPSILGEYEVYSKNVELCIAKDPRPNALSIQGPRDKIVIVTTGLVARLNDKELDAVLKHEEGHIKYNHTYKLLLFLILEYIMRIILLTTIYNKIGIYLLGIHLLGATLIFAALLQAFEYEADKYAKSPYLITALVKVDWNNIVDYVLYPLRNKLAFLTRTHPPTLSRIEKLWSSLRV